MHKHRQSYSNLHYKHALYKRGSKSPEQWKAELQESRRAEQASTTLRRLGKMHKWFYHILYYHITLLMSAHHSINSCSPLKSVFRKIGDTYQAYCNTYKIHAMATCHGGIGCPLDKGHWPEQREPKNCRNGHWEHIWLWCHSCFKWTWGDWTPQRSWV